MKKLLWIFLFAVPLFVQAQEAAYPWKLTFFGGGASLCTSDNTDLTTGSPTGCFAPAGYSFGASFGRAMTDTWSFELEGAYAHTTEVLPERLDISTNIIYTPELTRGRIWAGGTFFAKISRFGKRNDLFIALGGVGAYESQSLDTPPEVFHPPTQHVGITGGVCGGIGMNFAISESWSMRPEARYYAAANGLSGLRYTAGLTKTF